jgi:hypothetical protein
LDQVGQVLDETLAMPHRPGCSGKVVPFDYISQERCKLGLQPSCISEEFNKRRPDLVAAHDATCRAEGCLSAEAASAASNGSWLDGRDGSAEPGRFVALFDRQMMSPSRVVSSGSSAGSPRP